MARLRYGRPLELGTANRSYTCGEQLSALAEEASKRGKGMVSLAHRRVSETCDDQAMSKSRPHYRN